MKAMMVNIKGVKYIKGGSEVVYTALLSMAAMLAVTMPVLSHASEGLQALDDTQMSEQTGQDGLAVSITPRAGTTAGVLNFSKIILEDADGLTGVAGVANITGDASGVQQYTSLGDTAFNFNTNSLGFYALSGSTYALSTNAIKVYLDVNGEVATGKAGAVINIVGQSDLRRIAFNIKDITAKGSNSKIAFNNGINVDLASTFKIALFLGSEASNKSMVTLSSFDIDRLDFGVVSVDYAASGVALKTAARVYGMDLSGVAVDVAKDGLVITKPDDASTTTVDESILTIDNMIIGRDTTQTTYAAELDSDACTVCGIEVGTMGSSDAAQFNGLTNAPLANLKLSNVQIHNPVIAIKGL